jgi:hypothetical protein
MAKDDIDKAINGQEKETPAQPIEPKAPEQQTDPEVEKKKALLAELDTAKVDLEAEVQRLRAEKRDLKKTPPEGEDIPQIDDSDPSAKAWNNRINEKFAPVQQDVERGRAEIRQFAFDRFMADKPSLAKNPAKVKELMATYEKIRTASESTTEGVLLDLDKAYAATFNKELLEAVRQSRIDDAKNDTIFSEIAVSRGSTAYTTPKSALPKLTADEELQLAKWGMTKEEWFKMKAEIKEQ